MGVTPVTTMEKTGLLASLGVASILLTAGLLATFFLPEGNNRSYPYLPAEDNDRFVLPEREGLNATIMGSITSGGRYLVNHIKKDGSWDYLYDAGTDKVLRGYNVLRHAGTTYSLCLAFRYTGETDLYNGSVRTLNNLLSRYLVIDRVHGQEAAYIESGGVAKLGGAALAVLSIVELEGMDPLVTYERELELLGTFLLLMQRPNGSLQCYYRANEDLHSDYYPGEALLALSRLYDHTKDERYLVALGKGLAYYNDYFPDIYTAYSPWAGEAILRYYISTRNSTAADKCIRMANSCMQGQITGGQDPKVVGAFSKDPSASTASRLEAVFDAYSISNLRNDSLDLRTYGKAMELGATFLIGLQIDDVEAQGLPAPSKAEGGFPGSFSDLTIRIDYVQHSIVVLVKAMVYSDGRSVI